MEIGNSASPLQIPSDAFSSGQIGSKLWLCEELEIALSQRAALAPVANRTGEKIWIYGGWQGVLGFMLLSRKGLAIDHVRSFDIDPSCAANANAICANWVWKGWQFQAFTKDCNELEPAHGAEYSAPPTVIINTSVEHFQGHKWFEKIPKGTIVVLQASDFEHEGAVSRFSSEEKFQAAFPVSETLFIGTLRFDYESWGFNRLMLIGVR